VRQWLRRAAGDAEHEEREACAHFSVTYATQALKEAAGESESASGAGGMRGRVEAVEAGGGGGGGGGGGRGGRGGGCHSRGGAARGSDGRGGGCHALGGGGGEGMFTTLPSSAASDNLRLVRQAIRVVAWVWLL
jgi:hypothetical protein